MRNGPQTPHPICPGKFPPPPPPPALGRQAKRWVKHSIDSRNSLAMFLSSRMILNCKWVRKHHSQFPALTIKISKIFRRVSIPFYHLFHVSHLQGTNFFSLTENLLWFGKGSRVWMVRYENGCSTMEGWGKELKQRKTLLESLAALVFWKCGIDRNVRNL